jgi:hypothetical protein
VEAGRWEGSIRSGDAACTCAGLDRELRLPLLPEASRYRYNVPKRYATGTGLRPGPRYDTPGDLCSRSIGASIGASIEALRV